MPFTQLMVMLLVLFLSSSPDSQKVSVEPSVRLPIMAGRLDVLMSTTLVRSFKQVTRQRSCTRYKRIYQVKSWQMSKLRSWLLNTLLIFLPGSLLHIRTARWCWSFPHCLHHLTWIGYCWCDGKHCSGGGTGGRTAWTWDSSTLNKESQSFIFPQKLRAAKITKGGTKEKLYLSAICCSELPLGSDIMRSEMVWRRRWKVWGRGWAASPAITMSDRGCSQTPRSLSCAELMFIIRKYSKATFISPSVTINNSLPVLNFLCSPYSHHLPHPQVQMAMAWAMLQNAREYHAERWSGSHCTEASWMPDREMKKKCISLIII